MLQHRSLQELIGVLVGVTVVAASTWARLVLSPILGSDMALVFYLMAVLIAVAIGGRVAGLTTTLVSLAAGIYFVSRPADSPALIAELVRGAVFALEGVAISVAIGRLQHNAIELKRTAAQLEAERVRAERMALEDHLTGLGNRRAFRRDLSRALAQSQRDDAPLTLMIADIDGLKQTNDTEGHERGDELLIAVAQAITHSSRASDSAYRLGGDEFALLMPGAAVSEYTSMTHRLSQALIGVGERFNAAGASYGAAHYPDDADDMETLIRIADIHMYSAKAARQGGVSLPM